MAATVPDRRKLRDAIVTPSTWLRSVDGRWVCLTTYALAGGQEISCLATDNVFLTFCMLCATISMKKGRVVILLAGRHSGKKAVIIKQIDEGKKTRKFGHALVAGIDKGPKKITKRMSDKKIKSKARVRPFVKFVNYTHLLATRFTVKEDFDFKNIVTEEAIENPEERKAMKKALGEKLTERYMNPEGPGERQAAADFIFKRLRF